MSKIRFLALALLIVGALGAGGCCGWDPCGDPCADPCPQPCPQPCPPGAVYQQAPPGTMYQPAPR